MRFKTVWIRCGGAFKFKPSKSSGSVLTRGAVLLIEEVVFLEEVTKCILFGRYHKCFSRPFKLSFMINIP